MSSRATIPVRNLCGSHERDRCSWSFASQCGGQASILDLMQEAFAHHRAGRLDLFYVWSARCAASFARNRRDWCIASASWPVSTRSWWPRRAVSESVGRKLMQRVADWAREREAEAVSLEVYAFNDSARAFYASLGFEPLRLRLEQGL